MTEAHPALAVDITNCEREPIHIPGSIQPCGVLLALDEEWRVVRASANAGEILGLTEESVLGRALGDLVSAEAAERVRDATRADSVSRTPERFFALPFTQDGRRFDSAVHRSGELVVVEAERAAAEDDGAEPLAAVRRMMAELQHAEDVPTYCQRAADQVRSLLGFDRVMVYRFLHDDSGEVIAEARAEGIDSFLGHRFPESDIPRQARELYTRNWLRLIADTAYEPVPILEAPGTPTDPLDLSLSLLRSVSPIHLEYLANMGVAASLSISILDGARLWGLFACHNETPRHVSLARRSAAELFGQMFALPLEMRRREEASAQMRAGRRIVAKLAERIQPRRSFSVNLQDLVDQLPDLVASDGVGIWTEGHFYGAGALPPDAALRELVEYLGKRGDHEIVALEALASELPDALDYAETASGVLAVPVPRVDADYVLFFRRELVRSVTWAGDPAKPVAEREGARISPRKSFAAWRETVRGRSAPWSEADIAIAADFRARLVELALRFEGGDHTPPDALALAKVSDLEHRVRNILSLVRSLVGRSASSAQSLTAFVHALEGRIQVLARAYGTGDNEDGAPIPLMRLIEAELALHGGDVAARVSLTGNPVGLKPKAFATLALALHELLSNACWHGALAQPEGRVEIVWGLRTDGSLEIRWMESGLSGLTPPQDKGFGLTLIERTVPFELQGESEVDFRDTGIRARLVVPERYVASIEGPSLARPMERGMGDVEIRGRRALLVEDNMIIALDAEQMLLELGFQTVDLASSMDDARRFIEAEKPSIAILDLNLGSETSVPLAEDLQSKGVPVVFATGYGHSMSLPASIQDAVVVNKPYLAHTLKDAIAKAIGNA